MSSLNQTIVLNTDLFPLGSAINKSFQHITPINGNATIFGTVALDPALTEVQEIQVGVIDARAIVFLQADAGNNNSIEVGIYEGQQATTQVATFDNSSLIAGTLYTSALNVPTTTIGAGVGLTVDIVAGGGGVTTVTVNNPGSGYAVNDIVTVAQVGSGLDATIPVATLVSNAIFTTISEILAGEVAIFPLKYDPFVPAVNPKLAVRLGTYNAGVDSKINFAVIETA